MKPAKLNLVIIRGRDFRKDFIFADDEDNLIPIDTWAFKSQIREEDCPESSLMADFTIDVFPAESRIQLKLTDQETLTMNVGKGFWDLLITIGDLDESYACGKVKIECCPTEV